MKTQRNYVAKYASKFNHARTHIDRKKASKRGARKHRMPLEDQCSDKFRA